ncbi:hypothetical protein CBS101457_002221 [Exobasidium rhododendri]|nr:hypothetical protein CBS101457_002221 [Exobasidium rhododendri]
MAWRCSGHTNQELLGKMRSADLIKSSLVFQAMNRVDRANYVMPSSRPEAYSDSPQSIGFGATISAPHMHALAAEALLSFLKPGHKVLDVGSGSGYTMAIFFHLVQKGASGEGNNKKQVIGVDHIPQLVKMADDNLRKDGLGEFLDQGKIQVVLGDGRLGFAQGGPYDAIHVGAAASTIPEALVEQLAKPGRMFIPVTDPSGQGQSIWHVEKDRDGIVTKEMQFGVRYVPLTDQQSQWPSGD